MNSENGGPFLNSAISVRPKTLPSAPIPSTRANANSLRRPPAGAQPLYLWPVTGLAAG